MKSLKFFVAFALVAGLSIQAVSATPPGLYDVIFGSVSTSLLVKATNVQTQTMNVTILNANEDILVNEDLKNKADFTKQYNVAQLPDGSYQLVITKPNARITQPFYLESGYVQMSELEKKTTVFPVFVLRKEQLDVNVLSEKYGDILVNVLDDRDTPIFSDKITKTHLLHKRYDLTKLLHGNYRVEVIVNGEAFYYDLKK